MKPFVIKFETEEGEGQTSIVHWTKEAAREQFEAEHPEAVILEIYDDED